MNIFPTSCILTKKYHIVNKPKLGNLQNLEVRLLTYMYVYKSRILMNI